MQFCLCGSPEYLCRFVQIFYAILYCRLESFVRQQVGVFQFAKAVQHIGFDDTFLLDQALQTLNLASSHLDAGEKFKIKKRGISMNSRVLVDVFQIGLNFRFGLSHRPQVVGLDAFSLLPSPFF